LIIVFALEPEKASVGMFLVGNTPRELAEPTASRGLAEGRSRRVPIETVETEVSIVDKFVAVCATVDIIM
jgi:hypothetical protein